MNIAIVGAGLVGCLAAWRLNALGHDITLFERDLPGQNSSCAMTAAGMLAPVAERDKAEPIIWQLGARSLALWPKWLSTLPKPVFYQQRGSVVTAHAQDASSLQHYIAKISCTLTEQDQLQSLDREQLAQLEPELGHLPQAYYLPSEAQIDSQGLMHQLGEVLQASCTWQMGANIEHVSPGAVHCAGKKQAFDWVIDSRGLGAKAQQGALRGVRGEVIWLHAPEVHLQRPVRMLHPRYSIYIVPRPDHHYIIGASEIESEDSSPISVRTTLELLSAAYSVHRGFAEARVIDTQTNCRPAFADHMPQVQHQHGLTTINGLFRHGWLIGPALVEDAIQGLLETQAQLSEATV